MDHQKGIFWVESGFKIPKSLTFTHFRNLILKTRFQYFLKLVIVKSYQYFTNCSQDVPGGLDKGGV